jgi:threonine dehydratase
VTSPLEPAPAGLTSRPDVFLKREDVHELGAFKWRGALPALEQYRQEGAETVVTASTGNHAAASAWAGRRLDLEVVVFVPRGASATKLARLDELGADVRLGDGDFDATKDQARAFADEQGLPFFEDGDQPGQLDGYAAIGDEILEQAPEPLAAVVVPVGNGALLAGMGRAIASQALRVGVVPKEAPVMALSWEAGRPVECDTGSTFADGLAVRVAIPLAVEWLGEYADRMLQVSEREIARGVAAFDAVGIRVEGAAGAALAALPQLDEIDGPIVLVVTGRNIDDELLERCRDQPDSFPA